MPEQYEAERQEKMPGSLLKELTVGAVSEKLPEVISFVEENLEKFQCPMKAQMQISMAVEEIFVNIVYYAYEHKDGKATVRLEFTTDPRSVTITFIDRGTPYDPLAKEDPDVTLSAEDRKIGGLGIFMVKKVMDSMTYEYSDGQNILKLTKNL